jgi:hypothetical protein
MTAGAFLGASLLLAPYRVEDKPTGAFAVQFCPYMKTIIPL